MQKCFTFTDHAVATDTAVMGSWGPPDVAAAAVLLISLAGAVHPLALHTCHVVQRLQWLNTVYAL